MKRLISYLAYDAVWFGLFFCISAIGKSLRLTGEEQFLFACGGLLMAVSLIARSVLHAMQGGKNG